MKKESHFLRNCFDTFFLFLILMFAIKIHTSIYKNVSAQLSWYFGFFIVLFISSWIYAMIIRPRLILEDKNGGNIES